MFAAAVPAKASLAAVDLQPIQKKLRHRMARFLCAAAEFPHQRGSIALGAGAAV